MHTCVIQRYDKIEKTAESLRFRRRALKLENTKCGMAAARRKLAHRRSQLDLYSNYPVNPNTLKERLPWNRRQSRD